MFAVIKTGGKQYKVAEGDVLMVEKIGGQERVTSNEGSVVFGQVLLVVNGEVKVGKPTVSGASVTAKILEEGKGKKKIVFKYKSKTRQHKKKGHRQPYTKVQITKISP